MTRIAAYAIWPNSFGSFAAHGTDTNWFLCDGVGKHIQRWRYMLKCYNIAKMYCIYLFDNHLYVYNSRLFMRG